MDLGGVDVWGQIALETSQMYVEEGGVIRSRFANTVSDLNNFKVLNIYLKITKTLKLINK